MKNVLKKALLKVSIQSSFIDLKDVECPNWLVMVQRSFCIVVKLGRPTKTFDLLYPKV
jgi:hypothetical protein